MYLSHVLGLQSIQKKSAVLCCYACRRQPRIFAFVSVLTGTGRGAGAYRPVQRRDSIQICIMHSFSEWTIVLRHDAGARAKI